MFKIGKTTISNKIILIFLILILTFGIVFYFNKNKQNSNQSVSQPSSSGQNQPAGNENQTPSTNQGAGNQPTGSIFTSNLGGPGGLGASAVTDFITASIVVDSGASSPVVDYGSKSNIIVPSVTLSSNYSVFSENRGTAVLTATLSQPISKHVQVHLTFSGTAVRDTDYSVSDPVITVLKGSTTGSITITGITDLVNDPDRTVIATVDSVVNALELSPQAVTLTLKDDTILQADIDQLNSFISGNIGAKFAILGDSTVSGMGDRNSVYGELGSNVFPEGVENLPVNLLFYNTTHFLQLDENVDTVYANMEPGPAFRLQKPNSQILVSENPTLTYTYNHETPKRDTLTVVYLRRYNNRAPLFDIVSNSVTTTVDTYVAPIDFGSVTDQVVDGYQFATQEVSIPTSGSNFSFTLQNFRTIDRGNGIVEPEGTVAIFGFYYGHAIDFKNLAVSSTTLLNSGVANQARGVTTDDRFQAASNFGANVYFIGFGTNDSRIGDGDIPVSSIAAFKADYIARINTIKTANPNAVIVLMTAPTGETGSQYENNIEYNGAIRDVAAIKGVSLYDIEALIATQNRADVIADAIHPNTAGYTLIGDTITDLFGYDNFTIASDKTTNENSIIASINSIVTSTSNIVRESFFNVQSGTTVADRSSNNAGITLSTAATAIDLSFDFTERLRTLNFIIGHNWRYADAADLSFGDGAGTDQPFSIVWYGRMIGAPTGYIVAKRDNTTDTENSEYQLYINGGYAFVMFNRGTNTAYIGRRSLTTPSGKMETVMVTYDGSKANTGIKIYVDGVRVDTTNVSAGSYTGMTPGTAPVGNFRLKSGGGIESNSNTRDAFVSIIKENLSQTQVTNIHNALTGN